MNNDQEVQYVRQRICQAVGRRISELRQKQGLTQAQFADQSHTSADELGLSQDRKSTRLNSSH